MMIQTSRGVMSEERLEKRVIPQAGSSEVANVVATEYWFEGELVHRSITGELVGRDLGVAQQPLGA
jgi:hypothetical protein